MKNENKWMQYRALVSPRLSLAVQQLLRHRGAFLCILCDQTQPAQQVVVREQFGLRFSEKGAKHRET